MRKINTVIFDLGGVLINWDPMRLYRKIFPSEEEAKWFLNNICTYEWNLLHDAGQPVEVGMRQLAAKHPKWEKEIFAYYTRWEEMLGGAIEGTVDILRQCVEDPDLKVVALTNWSAETFPIARRQFEFLDWFDEIVVSGEEKTRKPQPELYEILLQRCHFSPEQAVFIDDSLPNIEQGERMGIQGIHFQNPEALATALRIARVL